MHTARRIGQLLANPISGAFDYEHMKSIHRYIFQDVYEWAGEERTAPTDGPMSKHAPDVVNFPVGDPNAPLVHYAYYPAGAALTNAAEKRYALLRRDNLLVGLNRRDFVHALAGHWGELNAIHSFRDDNTRSQIIFFHDLANKAGFELNLQAFQIGSPQRTEFVNARNYSLATGRNHRLANMLNTTITEVPTIDRLRRIAAAQPQWSTTPRIEDRTNREPERTPRVLSTHQPHYPTTLTTTWLRPRTDRTGYFETVSPSNATPRQTTSVAPCSAQTPSRGIAYERNFAIRAAHCRRRIERESRPQTEFSCAVTSRRSASHRAASATSPRASARLRKLINVNGSLPKPWSLHCLRHWLATSIYQATQDIVIVQQLLGHENVSTTQRYVAIANDSLREAVNQIAA